MRGRITIYEISVADNGLLLGQSENDLTLSE